MQKYTDVVLDRHGNAVSGATVTLQSTGGANQPAYASDALGTDINPMTTDADGRFTFYTKDGTYNLVVSGTGINTQTVTISIKDPRGAENSGKGLGITADGTTDDYAALLAFVTALQAAGAGTEGSLPAGTICIGTPLSITGTPVRLRGAAMGIDAYGSITASAGTTIKYIGSASALPVIKFAGVGGSFGLKNLRIDANSLCDIGLLVDYCNYGVIDNVEVKGAVKYGVKLDSSDGATACAWNRFNGLAIDITASGALAGLWLTGSATSNVCHNVFEGLRINHGGTSGRGIDLGNCDNNLFLHSYVAKTAGSGVGVNVIPTELAGFPNDNLFLLLEATNGWSQPGTTTASNLVLGYNQSAAAVTNNTKVLIFDENGVFNRVLGGTTGSSADPRTALQVGLGTSPNVAQALVGFQGTSANFYDASIHHFRDGSQADKVTFSGNVVGVTSGGSYQVNSVQVLAGRITGYAAMTGSPDKGTAYATGSITLAQLAGRVAQLQADLTTHGIIGA